MSNVTIEREGNIALVRFDRGKKSNPLSENLMRELTSAAEELQRDYSLAAVILTGRNDNFSLGLDIKDPKIQQVPHDGLSERREKLKIGKNMCRAWSEIEAITISAIRGWCVGGGVALSVCTDIRIASKDSQLYLPEVERGMNMAWGAIPRIVNLIGPAKAKRFIALAEQLSAEQALNWGLVDFSSQDAVSTAMEVARKATEIPNVSLRMCKTAIDQHANALNEVSSWADTDQFALAQTGDDYREGIESFIEGRPPKFTGT